MEGQWKFQRGGGGGGGGGRSQKPKCLKENMGLNWNFQRGGGFKPKNLPWEGYGYLLVQEQHSVNL